VNVRQMEREHALAIVNTDVERSALRRLSPRPNRWQEVGAFDSQVAGIEHHKAEVGREAQAVRERLPAVELDDKERLAAWMDTQHGERPIPAARGLHERLEQCEREMQALDLSASRALLAKEKFVARHRGRLVKEARQAVERNAARSKQLLTEMQAARDDVCAAADAYRWAANFPNQESRPDDEARYLNGGRRSVAFGDLLPYRLDYQQVLAAITEDTEWLAASVAEKPREDADLPNPDREAIWTDSDLGRAAIARKNAEVAARFENELRPRTEWQP
jgi:hypothetical protein